LNEKVLVYTLGHSSRSIEEVIYLLRYFNVKLVVDVRRWPKSRRYPWFNMERLREALGSEGMDYLWLGRELGGYRRFGVDVDDSGVATCFKSTGFRAYAIYLTSNSEAIKAMERLEELAATTRLALFCSERLPWRCHRKIISDWLVMRGFKVLHIIDVNRVVEHKPSKCVRLSSNGVVFYV